MAKKVKDSVEVRQLRKADLQRVLRESTRQRTKAKEAASAAGGFIKNQIELYDLEKVAFKWVSKLQELDSIRRNEVFREFLRYVHMSDMLDQADAFDETWPLMREMLAQHERNAKTADDLEGQGSGAVEDGEGPQGDQPIH